MVIPDVFICDYLFTPNQCVRLLFVALPQYSVGYHKRDPQGVKIKLGNLIYFTYHLRAFLGHILSLALDVPQKVANCIC